MNRLVIDASVAVKWLLPAGGETLVRQAGDLLNRYANGEISFLVPDLFWAETANILWKTVRYGRLTKDAAAAALAAIKERNFATVSSRSLMNLAFKIAIEFDRTAYDALYVALAIESKSQFVTADERLANALALRLPVKWLGALY